MTDDVLREVRATREEFARSHGYDVYAMAATLRRLDEAGDRPVVRLAPRRPADARPDLGRPNPALQQTAGA